MKKLFLSLIVFAFLINAGFQMHAQNLIFPEGTYYSDESTQTADGNIVTISQPMWPYRLHLTKMETDGDILWNADYDPEIEYTPNKIFGLPDGSIAAFSTSGMIKCNAAGEFLFELDLDPTEFGYEPVPGETYLYITDITLLEDGFEIISDGRAYDPTNSLFHVVTKLNFSGEPVWSHSYIVDDIYSLDVVNHDNKTFVFLYKYGIENQVEIIDDVTGNVLTTTILPDFWPRDMQDVGTGIVFAGIEELVSDKLVKINYDGDILWTKEFPFPDADSINGIIQIEQLSSGTLAGLVVQGDYPDTRYILRYYSPEGEIVSEVDEFADYDPMYFNDFKIRNDQLIFTGYYNDAAPATNGLVLFTDSTGSFFKTCISGKVYYDENENDLKDIGELVFKNAIINAGPLYGVTNDSGDYLIPVFEPGSYNVEIENPAYWDLNEPAFYSIDIDAGMDDDTLFNNDFRLDYTAPVTDLQIIVFESNVVPGTTTSMSAYIYNYGNQYDVLATGYLHHPSELTYTGGTPYDSYTDTTFIWTTPPLDPGEHYYFHMEFTVDEDLDLGEVLTTTANVEPLAGDYNPIDNYSIDYETVVESCDPNHKTASPEGVGINGSTDPETEWIEYTIEFQNLGTAPANFINVIDTIDNDFIFNSIEMIASTHQYEMELIAPNVIQWHFENINLPDSASDPAGSIGHIIFRLKLNEDATIGTQLTNTAAIYFDYNQPVITNTTLNTLEELPQVGIEEEIINNLFSIYPNPVNDELTIEFTIQPENEYKMEIFDLSGKKINTTNKLTGESIMHLSTQTLLAGFYFLKITDLQDGNTKSESFIKN